MNAKDKDYCCQEAGLPSKQLEEKMCKIKELHIDLAREFTRILNDRGISGSIIEFSVHEREFDDVLSWVQDDNAKIGLGCWTCPPDCVCCGIKGRFLTAPSAPANP